MCTTLVAVAVDYNIYYSLNYDDDYNTGTSHGVPKLRSRGAYTMAGQLNCCYTCIISILRAPQICIVYYVWVPIHKTVGRCTRKRFAGLMKLYYYYHYYYGHWLNACIYYNTIYLPIIFVPRHTFRLILNGDLMRSMTSVTLYNVRWTLYIVHNNRLLDITTTYYNKTLSQQFSAPSTR